MAISQLSVTKAADGYLRKPANRFHFFHSPRSTRRYQNTVGKHVELGPGA